MFGNCNQVKYKILKNELKEAIYTNTKTDASEIKQDPTPHCLRNCCRNDLRVARIRKIDIDHRLGHADNNKKEESLTRGYNYLRILPFEEGDYECARALTNHEGHGACPKLIIVKAFGIKFQGNLSKVTKTLFKACYKDLVNEVCEFLLATTLNWLHHITTLMPSNFHNFKIFELLLETSKNHGILRDTLFLYSKIVYDNHKMSISQFPMSSRN